MPVVAIDKLPKAVPVRGAPARSGGGHVDEKRVAELRAQLAAMPDEPLVSQSHQAANEAAASLPVVVPPPVG